MPKLYEQEYPIPNQLLHSHALVQKDAVDSFKEAVGKHYEEVVGYAPSFYIAEVAGGTRVLD